MKTTVAGFARIQNLTEFLRIQLRISNLLNSGESVYEYSRTHAQDLRAFWVHAVGGFFAGLGICNELLG